MKAAQCKTQHEDVIYLREPFPDKKHSMLYCKKCGDFMLLKTMYHLNETNGFNHYYEDCQYEERN